METTQFLFDGLKSTLAPLKILLTQSTQASDLQSTLEANLDDKGNSWTPPSAEKLVVLLENVNSPKPG